MTMYQEFIRENLARSGYVGKYQARHIEAWMRLEHGTLDALSPKQFADEVEVCRQCCDADPTASEQLATSLAL